MLSAFFKSDITRLNGYTEGTVFDTPSFRFNPKVTKKNIILFLLRT